MSWDVDFEKSSFVVYVSTHICRVQPRGALWEITLVNLAHAGFARFVPLVYKAVQHALNSYFVCVNNTAYDIMIN